MKKYLPRFLLIILLTACWPGWAERVPTLQIKVEGISDPLKEKMMTLLATRSQEISQPLTADKVQRFYNEAPQYIRKGLQAYGYFKPQISPRILQSGANWNLTFYITPGPVVKIIHVDLEITGEGNTDPAFKKLSDTLAVKAGQNFDVDNYQAAKDALFNVASNRGYFDAKMVLSQIIININYQQASIVLHFDTGARYRFGPTLFPPSDLNSGLLERFLRYKPGEYYSAAKVQKTQQVLAGSGYFSQSVVTPVANETTDHNVPIKVELTPVRPQRYTFGLGYGTDTGPRGTLGFNWIPINSYGHHINILARGSYINSSGQTRQNNTINASYIVPGRDPATDSYAFNVGYGNISQQTGYANSFKTSLSYNTIFNDSWQQTLALTYLKERYKLTTTPPTPNINAEMLYPNGHWQYIYNRTQNQKVINNGISATFDVAGGLKALPLTQTNMLQGKVGFKALGTFEPTHTRFLFRSQAGHTEIHELSNLPLSLQLFAGGPASIRGFTYNSIGPGRDLLIFSGEIQQKVYGDWYVAGFIDSGVVSNSDSSVTNAGGGHYKAGAGGGVVVLTPIGAVELALARPVIQGGKTWQLEFSVGAEL